MDECEVRHKRVRVGSFTITTQKYPKIPKGNGAETESDSLDTEQTAPLVIHYSSLADVVRGYMEPVEQNYSHDGETFVIF